MVMISSKKDGRVKVSLVYCMCNSSKSRKACFLRQVGLDRWGFWLSVLLSVYFQGWIK